MSGLYRWLDERAGLTDILNFAIHKKVPNNVSWFHTLGTTSLFLFMVQVVTGIFLAMNYTPHVEEAHRAVLFIQQDTQFGHFIRGLHSYGATMMIAVVVLHMLRVAFYGAYRKPRELTWLFGVGLLICTMALGLTGYLLPWDQKAYYATKVVLRIVESATDIPGWVGLPIPIGEWSRAILQGSVGDDLGASTLTHFYAFHTMLLPFLMILLVGVHLWLVVRQGIATPWVAKDSDRPRTAPFWPTHVAKDLVVCAFVFGLMIAMYFAWGTHLDELSDPLDDLGYLPRPEWYFMWVFQLLKLFPGPLIAIGTIIIPTAILLFLFLLPWLDRGATRHPKDRPVIMTLGGVFLAGMVWLTWQSYVDDSHTLDHKLETLGFASADRTWYEEMHHERSLYHDYSDDESEGQQIFARAECRACHMMNGLGGQGPPSGCAQPPSLTFIGSRMGPAYMRNLIRNGFGTCMPSVADRKDVFPLGSRDHRLDQLVAYLQRHVEPPGYLIRREEIAKQEVARELVEARYQKEIDTHESRIKSLKSSLQEPPSDTSTASIQAKLRRAQLSLIRVQEKLDSERDPINVKLKHLRIGSLRWPLRDPEVKEKYEASHERWRKSLAASSEIASP